MSTAPHSSSDSKLFASTPPPKEESPEGPSEAVQAALEEAARERAECVTLAPKEELSEGPSDVVKAALEEAARERAASAAPPPKEESPEGPSDAVQAALEEAARERTESAPSADTPREASESLGAAVGEVSTEKVFGETSTESIVVAEHKQAGSLQVMESLPHTPPFGTASLSSPTAFYEEESEEQTVEIPEFLSTVARVEELSIELAELRKEVLGLKGELAALKS